MKKIFTLIATALLTMGASAQTLINYPASKDGITLKTTDETQVTYATTKINTNTNTVDGIKFGKTYKYAESDEYYYATLTTEGGFKAGDVISITGCYNHAEEKNAAIRFFSDPTGEPIWTTENFINGRTVAEDPVAQTFALTADAATLYFGRQGNTGTFILSLTITRGGASIPEVWSASSLTFDPETKIMQEAVKSENKGASFVIPEDANIFPTGTWETANATGDISPVTNWLAAQSNPSLYATALREFTFTASTASVSMKAVSTPNTDSSDAEAWQNDARTNMGLNTDACKIKWDSYVKPKTGNPSLGYYDFIETTEQGTAHRVYDDIWKIGCGKAPGKGTYYEFTFAKAGSMVMGVFMNRPNQSAVVVVDKETLNPLPYTDLSFEGFCQNNTFKYPDNGAESTDPTYQKFNFREDYTIDVSAQSGRPLLGYLSFPVEAKTYFVFQPSSQVGIYGFQFTAGGDPSGVETIKTEKVWNANAPMYNLSGQKVDKSYKGIVIQNGRKFVNK